MPVLPMLDSISLALATPIAKTVLNKFYEGLGGKLSEKAIALAEAPIKKLAQWLWQRWFQGRPEAQELEAEATQGALSPTAEAWIQQQVEAALAEPDMVQGVEPLAQELQQVLVQIEAGNARNVQQVSGGQGQQVNDPNAPVIQAGDNARFYFGSPPPD
jgi:signal transduction histidine kinase